MALLLAGCGTGPEPRRATESPPEQLNLAFPATAASDLAFSPDGALLVYPAGGEAVAFDPETMRVRIRGVTS